MTGRTSSPSKAHRKYIISTSLVSCAVDCPRIPGSVSGACLFPADDLDFIYHTLYCYSVFCTERWLVSCATVSDVLFYYLFSFIVFDFSWLTWKPVNPRRSVIEIELESTDQLHIADLQAPPLSLDINHSCTFHHDP